MPESLGQLAQKMQDLEGKVMALEEIVSAQSELITELTAVIALFIEGNPDEAQKAAKQALQAIQTSGRH